MQKICDTQKILENEVEHYKRVSKKYKRAQVVFQNAAVATGTLRHCLVLVWPALSHAGVGLGVAAPLAGVSAVLEVVSASCTAFRKPFTLKVSKHEKTIILSQSKLNSISEVVSEALTDGEISDQEFAVIISELEKYSELKTALTQKTAKPTKLGEASEREKIKRELRKKKLGSLTEIN